MTEGREELRARAEAVLAEEPGITVSKMAQRLGCSKDRLYSMAQQYAWRLGTTGSTRVAWDDALLEALEAMALSDMSMKDVVLRMGMSPHALASGLRELVRRAAPDRRLAAQVRELVDQATNPQH
ncbi:hypothetical protein TSH7_10035 [Azospirillum sp. TSH7]|uniref:hypothetical protein n=1 Tax=unclassified Azospirillum TaxID=2630922 RepID=UPI000D606D48|nr:MULTISPECIES: hypothetical protein [unclassified Azospirillum]PWC64007.1 hypothetical protein TSH20_19130 [Azospirillum sp. TSH20]PWC64870.1 hypothetical protein TSH7_10035 [Azospirillum sp. TSH7]